MTNQEKNRADVLLSLSKVGWDNFERRRAHQWKFNIGIWTAIAAFAGIVLTKGNTHLPTNCALAHVCGVFWIAIVGTHTYWLFSLMIRDRLDKSIAIFYENLLKEMLKVEYSSDIDNLKDRVKRTDYWSPLASTIFTGILTLAAILAVFV